MTLANVFSALSANEGLNITLVNSAGSNLITFNASGYASVESDLGARTVTAIKVISSSSVEITIGDAA